MKILVVGAGAVGSLFAARLSAAGNRVELTGRPEHVAAIGSHGLRVEGTGAGTFWPTALSDLARATAPEAILLTVKTFDLSRAATELTRRFPTRVPTVLPQNGLNVERLVVDPSFATPREDPSPWLVRAVNSIPVTLVGPGVVRQAGEGQVVLHDPRAGGASSGATEVIRELLDRAGVPVRLVGDLERELWRKALVNAAINPVTALHRVTNGRLLESPYREEAQSLLREAQQAAASSGFAFADEEADRDLDRVVRATAENRSSMLQDRDRGRPTEVDAISGEILRAAVAHGIDLPLTRSVVERLRGGALDPAGGAQPS
ncbi:MAG: 2-dehydropantoate 2-reductase [Thermoplasmata archaeon]|nr:2-dehydropantoate 2-reductase [Thermoplasmata archaeon]